MYYDEPPRMTMPNYTDKHTRASGSTSWLWLSGIAVSSTPADILLTRWSTDRILDTIESNIPIPFFEKSNVLVM